MRARVLVIAAALCAGSAALAEPAKTSGPETEQRVEKLDPVVLAAADKRDQQAEEIKQDATDPAKPVRRARVTTCRCGDQNPSD